MTGRRQYKLIKESAALQCYYHESVLRLKAFAD